LCSQELSYKETGQQMLAAREDKLAQTPHIEVPETIEKELALPVQIKKHMRRHNKPKKAQDYVVSLEDTRLNIL
jgi:hypothetical protein